MADLEPIPDDPVVLVGSWRVTNRWYDWLLNFATIITQTSRRKAQVVLNSLSASIGATALIAGNPGGRFRVTVYVRIEQAATTSSSITVTFGFTDSTVACSVTTTAITNGIAGQVWSQSFMVDNDQAVPLTYLTTYASVGATPMKYRLRIVVEAIPTQ